jgi:hypothetical protein
MWIGKDGNTRRIELTFTNSLVATLVALLSRWALRLRCGKCNWLFNLTQSHVGGEQVHWFYLRDGGLNVTVVFMDLGLLSERWLRHAGQLARNKGRFDKTCACNWLFNLTQSHVGGEQVHWFYLRDGGLNAHGGIVFMDLGLLSERWLRHAGQLARNKGRFDKTCAVAQTT